MLRGAHSLTITEGLYDDRAHNPHSTSPKPAALSPASCRTHEPAKSSCSAFSTTKAIAKTLETGFVTFWSRTRNKLWMKGETSGNRLRVISAATDCDNDALLFRVEVEGDGLVCHEGTVSCFTRPIELKALPNLEETN